VLDLLPEAERSIIQRRLRAACATTDPQQAGIELEASNAARPASGPVPPLASVGAWPRS
jgi:hypothetical protein